MVEMKYFPDTDTLLMHFANTELVEMLDVTENILIELDHQGVLVSLTIEHGKQHIDIENFSYSTSG